jgi:hypothetical protein
VASREITFKIFSSTLRHLSRAERVVFPREGRHFSNDFVFGRIDFFLPFGYSFL